MSNASKDALKLILGIIIFWSYYSGSKSFSHFKEKVNSNSNEEEIIKYIHSCERRIMILLIIIIIQNMALA